MKVKIRPIKLEDAAGLNEMRNMPGVAENIFSVPSERVMSSEEYIRSLSRDDYVLVAEEQTEDAPKIIGCSSVRVDPRARSRHTGELKIYVHTDFQRMGAGSLMMERLIDLADNWLFLKRLELTVLADNEFAKKFFCSRGFEEEGVLRCKLFQGGAYKDACVMGRIRSWI